MVSLKMKLMKRIFPVTLSVFLALSLFSILATAQEESQENVICLVYFTGVGCPHCAVSDPFVLQDLPNETRNLVIIEYEIYQQSENSPLLMGYNNEYGTALGVPLLIFDETYSLMGDRPILDGVDQAIEYMDGGNECLLVNDSLSFEELDLDDLPGLPKIWANNRVLMRVGKGRETEELKSIMKEFLLTDTLCKKIEEEGLNQISPQNVPLSGKNLKFSNAIELGTNWIIQYNENDQQPCDEPVQKSDLTLLILMPLLGVFLMIFIFALIKVKKRGGK